MWTKSCALAMFLVAYSRTASAQFAPHALLGNEFLVNTYTTGNQSSPDVAIGDSGALVVWGGQSDGSSTGVFARRYDPSGSPVGPQFQVNTYTTGIQSVPSVDRDAAGNYVVVWNSTGQDGSGRGVFGQRLSNTGALVGGEFQVNTYTTDEQYLPDVAVGDTGNFIVTWIDKSGLDGSNTGIFARQHASNGAPLGPAFQVNAYTTGYQIGPAVDVDANDNFVVIWSSIHQDGSTDGIFGQRYLAGGTGVGEFQVNTYTTDNQSQPAVAMDASGGFVVAWRSYDGSSADIFARRYSSGGVALSPEFLVNTYTTQSQFEPVVADDGAGNVVIAWTSAVPHFSSSDVFAQRYDAGSNPLGGEFRVNTITTYSQTAPTVAADASGNFIVAWSTFANGADDDTAAQRFAAARTIAGKKLLVKDTGSSETMRKVVVVATESSTDVGPTVLGDPVSNGGTLRVVTRGTLDSDQTYVLDAAGWTAAGSVGFRYSGPTGGDGDPVKKLLIKRTPGGKALLKAVLSGSVGTQMLDVVPPDTGDEAGIVLSINGGAVYCAGFGGAAGGAETADDAQRWKVLNAVAQPGCPTP